MKQISQNFRSGTMIVNEVPTPVLEAGGVLVRARYSLISAGTEGGTVRLAKKSLLGKARSRPDLVRKVLKTLRTQGVLTTYKAVTGQLDMPVALGYSAAGVVTAVGEDVQEFQVGDRVACIGAAHASHAEVMAVPKNLAARLPDAVGCREACFGGVATVALNGVRRAEARVGESVLVVGLGLVGQLAVQMLRAAGCRVAGVDLDPEKLALATTSGAHMVLERETPNLVEVLRGFSHGNGFDAVLITAVAPTNDPVVLAGRVTRKGGRVVAVGRIPYELPRDDYLFKELEFRTAFNAGAGVDDPVYELHGIDYPIDRVRWTMNRNLTAFNHLLAERAIRLDHLITHEFPLERAPEAFGLVSEPSKEIVVGVLLRYEEEKESPPAAPIPLTTKAGRTPRGSARVGVVGTGSFANTFLIPILARHAELRGIASAKGLKARVAGEKHGFAFVGTPEQVIADEDTDAVFIATRHDSHAPLAIQALQAGKDVYVEKPLALSHEQLDAIVAAQAQHGGRVMVGHNRRFAKYAVELRDLFASRGQPLSMMYRYNPGPLGPGAWIRDPVLGGGRLVGEGCHFIDFCQFLVGSAPRQVFTQSIHANSTELVDEEHVFVNLSYADGSMGLVAYLSGGDGSYTQERIEVYADGIVAVIEDWQTLEISRGGKIRSKRSHVAADKGFGSAVRAFLTAVRQGEESPFPFADYALSMRTTLAARDSMREGRAVALE